MLNIVVALSCEAQSITQNMGLRSLPEPGPFPVFSNEDTQLIVSGIGKVNAAAATAWLQARFNTHTDMAWLNIGIAGHANLTIGTARLIHRIRDAANGQCWYPPCVFNHNGASGTLCTIDSVTEDYHPTDLYDMEASGFYATASRFATMELVQCIKIISDNRANPSTEVNREQVRGLIHGRMAELTELGDQLRDLSREWRTATAPPPGLDIILAKHHFTVSQRHQLHTRLRQWQHRGLALPKDLESARNARAILQVLHTLESP